MYKRQRLDGDKVVQLLCALYRGPGAIFEIVLLQVAQLTVAEVLAVEDALVGLRFGKERERERGKMCEKFFINFSECIFLVLAKLAQRKSSLKLTLVG